MSKDLPENPGREALMITVEHAPGGSSAIHRHNAHAFVYVLEGSVVMQLKGGQQVTLPPGQTFYEGPDDNATILPTAGVSHMKTKYAVALAMAASFALGVLAVQGLRAQAKPAGYVVVEAAVTDKDAYAKEFIPPAAKAIEEGGGKYVVRGGKTTSFQG